LAIPVLLILAVLWAAVLVPPVLRSRSESRRGFGDFTSRLGALAHRNSPTVPMRARAGRSRLHAVPPVAGSTPRASTTMSPSQKRRRDVLMILVGAAVVSLGLAVLVNPMLWIAQVIADVLLVVYLSLLVTLKRRGSLASSGTDTWSTSAPAPRPVALSHPRLPARPELAPLPGASQPRRTAAG
jgi:Flp pilus assembly protein TadB